MGGVRLGASQAPIEQIEVSAYKIPTDLTESDGTIAWDSTTLVLVEAGAGGEKGVGYGYADAATRRLIRDLLAKVVQGRDALSVPESWSAMVHAVRNLGRPGIASMAIAAVDNALWDLKGRLLGLPLVTLLGSTRDSIPVYGSGGFTSYTLAQLSEQLGGWAREGIGMVKMKVGRDPGDDINRVRVARSAIGPHVKLFVDANGAYNRKQALAFAEAFTEFNVTWFEEPVVADDLEGLHFLRDRAPAGMDIAAGEYGYDLGYFRQMLGAEAVDVVQADATRCEGITGFLKVGQLCEAHFSSLSAHTAPTLHAHPCCALEPAIHVKYFHDHARIEHMLFDGARTPVRGALYPDLSRPGLGLEFKRQDAEPFAIRV
jgi:L-alanine-DL-glutamate epimerase-like enolase superfamily enzyme